MALSKIDVANMLTGVTPVANGGTALSSGFTNGKLGQVVNAVFDVDTDVSSSTFADLTDGSGETLEVAITPSATSSKCLIEYTIQASMASNRGYKTKLLRTVGGSDTAIMTQPDQKDTYGDGNTHAQRSSVQFLDSPSTTSAITYTVQVATDGCGTVTFANANSQCMITVMEILA